MTDDRSTTGDEQRDFDRLVDGEMSNVERLSFLGRFEQQPERWRRLALTFLEAQTWRETIHDDVARRETAEQKTPVEPIAPAPVVSDSTGRPTNRTVRLHWGATALGMAASFLVALTLGLALRGAWSGAPETSRAIAAREAAPPAQLLEDPSAQLLEDLAAAPSTAIGHDEEAVPLRRESAAADNASPRDASPRDQRPTVRHVGQVNEDWLPADWNSDESQFSGAPTPAVPEQVLRSLQRLGHEVSTQRTLFPIELPNGQRAWVPIDEVDIRYVGNQYQ